MAMMANTEINEGVFRRYHVENTPPNLVDREGLSTMVLPRQLIRPWSTDWSFPRVGPGTLVDPQIYFKPDDIDLTDTRTWPKPPTFRPCEEGPPSRKKPRERGEKSLWDDKGGEWRLHKPDKYHKEPHWDYKPSPTKPWERIPISTKDLI